MKTKLLLFSILFSGSNLFSQASISENDRSSSAPEVLNNYTAKSLSRERTNTSFVNDKGDENIPTTISVNTNPNPFMSKITIEIPAGNFNAYDKVVFELTDVLGNVLRSENVLSEKFDFERGHLSPGGYFYTIVSNGKILATGKLTAE